MVTAALEKESITVTRVGKFGVEVNGEWYGINKPLKLTHFASNKAYDVLIKRGPQSDKYPNGKRYIAQIVLEKGAVAPAAASPSSVAKPAPEKDAYWQNKDESMKIGGIYHDVATITAALVQTHALSTESALATFKQVLADLVALRG